VNPEKKAEKEKKKLSKEPEKIFVDSTPKGQKKELSEMPVTYQPKYVEAAWQDWWEARGFYTPNREAAKATAPEKKFIMVIPPPNVTGSLHLGHALTAAIEDTLTRWHRMRGDVTLYVPGTDHAGIATQSVVEKKLKKDTGLSRSDFTREEFVEKVWQWKEQYGNRITSQIRHLGSSVDWSREAFTMDENLSRAVTEAFCRFHEAGILYRSKRLVNWSCALKSAISEIEVDYVELEGRTMMAVPKHTREKYEFGTLTSFAYKIDGTEEEIVVATTRLETMLGDTAIAVHPDDSRYKHLHGKFATHPFVDRKIPIITDGILVDMTFGTGAVKITPAHDPNDYECGTRNNLPFITIFTEEGRVNQNGGRFANLMRYDARVEMEAALKELGLFRGKEDNKMRLGICSRSKDIIEPLVTPQWYVNCKPMAEQACQAVREGRLKITPQFHESTWFRWLEEIKDWCISRQLWWGHRIPAYFAQTKDEAENSPLDKTDMVNNDRWVVARTAAAALEAAAAHLGVDTSEVEI
jgi:valyl-tRNA synthetase